MAETFTVITCMKTEGAFLIDWMARRKALGFDHVVVGTNDCADPTAAMARRLQTMGLARHHATRFWPATSIQRAALRQVRRYAEVTGAEVIPVPWRMFGPRGWWTYRDRSVTRAFLHAARATGPGAPAFACPESLFRGARPHHRIGIHAPVRRAGAAFRVELPGAVPLMAQHHRMFVQADHRFAQVNHYALRAGQSFFVERDRGRVNHTGQELGLQSWDRFDRADERCDAIQRIAPAVAGWRARLMADDALAALHRRAVRWHRARAAALAADPARAGLVAHIRERLDQCASLPS